MAPAIVYDVLRLFIGASRRTPRGIDRVDLAYARHLFGGWRGDCHGLMPTPWGLRLYDRRRVLRGLDRLEALWHEGGTAEDGLRQAYIPYTDRAIKWHTDGYYNPSDRQVRSFVLHCVHSAAQGGGNRLMDHEIAYLMLRDENPDFIRALSAPDAMTIPERTDEYGVARAAQTGPVFSIDPANGRLHMRYTARTRSIVWKQDAATLAAVASLEKLLASELPHIHRTQMEPGMGLLCNNVLHDRAAFKDDQDNPRLLYRARYHERIAES